MKPVERNQVAVEETWKYIHPWRAGHRRRELQEP
jgi:hypothetical protein